MAGKGKTLRELMASRGKGQSSKGQSSKGPTQSQAQTLPPVVSQIPSDLGLKVNLDLKKKRPIDTPEEGEVVAQPTKQQKTTRAPRSKRGDSAESRDEENRAEVRATPRTWSPKLELDGVAIPYNVSIREYNRGQAGYKFKESKKQRKSAEAGLKSAETQAEDQRKELYSTQINLATEKQAVLDLKVALQKIEDEPRRVKKEAQLIQEAAEAEKRIPADSALRLPENIFYPQEIRENPDGTQAASEQDLAVPDAVPVPDKAKDPTTDPTIEAPPPQPEQKEDPPAKA
ncbi:uncharacterized protein LOC126696172 [Quercus robur]|uniref:uncharacterized protein LOC126696172 n=1 Tax=Quercus robur TaxID=38942 RepID=UPI0021638C20|nr:uncharacterized protein LOC126696172 [Quercus robur]